MRVNYFFIGSIALNVVLFILLFKGCNCDCPKAEVTRHTIDTLRPDVKKVIPTVEVKVPEVKKVLKPRKIIQALYPDSVVLQRGVPLLRDTDSDAADTCSYLVIYSDTTRREGEYMAVIDDTVQHNRITGRKVSFYNLGPRIVERIEKVIPLKERVRLYAGVFAGVRGSYSEKKITGWSAGPELALTFPVGAMVGYGYDARNNGHQLHFLYKITLRQAQRDKIR